MAVFNAAKREIDIKIVYYGPALCGKTTNVQCVHKMLSPHQRGDIMSLATKDDRTLFFDFLPIELGDVKGFKTRFHVYTVPGQVYYALTRRAVLTGVDGVVFVADSQPDKMDENIESLNDLNENLKYYKKDLTSVPFVMQYNKRDLENILPVAQLNTKLNTGNVPYFAASAVDGTGVIETLTACCKLVLKQMDSSGSGKKRRRQRQEEAAAPQPADPAPQPAPPAPPPPAPPSPDEDDSEPIIKIISGDDALEADTPSIELPDETAPAAEPAGNSFDAASGIGIGSLDDMPTFDAEPLELSSLDDGGGLDTSFADASPLEGAPAEQNLTLADDAGSEISIDDGGYELPSISDDGLPSLELDSDPRPVSLDEPMSAPLPAPAAGGAFAVTGCGQPQKISGTAVKLPVTLKNDSTGQTCTVSVTITFDDFSIG